MSCKFHKNYSCWDSPGCTECSSEAGHQVIAMLLVLIISIGAMLFYGSHDNNSSTKIINQELTSPKPEAVIINGVTYVKQ